jgi:DNA-binding transcriptional ArsR family regulator
MTLMNKLIILKALSNDKRLQILEWLKDPQTHFPKEVRQAACDRGICCGSICRKSDLSQSTISSYLSLLEKAGLIVATRQGQWKYFRRNNELIQNFIYELSTDI